MSTIITRVGKGSPLTNAEVDANLVNLNTDKLELVVNGVSSGATITPASTDTQYNVTALATNAAFAVPSGTPVNGSKLIIRIKDNGTIRTLSWDAIYRAVGIVLPTATVANKTTYVGFEYNSTDSKWDGIATAQEA